MRASLAPAPRCCRRGASRLGRAGGVGRLLQCLADHQVAVSMSRHGNPFDKAESFMKTLKTEEFNARSFKAIDDARMRIDDFIANIYATERLHSALGHRSPLEFEAAYAQTKTNRHRT
jgi:putative transposase